MRHAYHEPSKSEQTKRCPMYFYESEKTRAEFFKSTSSGDFGNASQGEQYRSRMLKCASRTHTLLKKRFDPPECLYTSSTHVHCAGKLFCGIAYSPAPNSTGDRESPKYGVTILSHIVPIFI